MIAHITLNSFEVTHCTLCILLVLYWGKFGPDFVSILCIFMQYVLPQFLTGRSFSLSSTKLLISNLHHNLVHQKLPSSILYGYFSGLIRNNSHRTHLNGKTCPLEHYKEPHTCDVRVVVEHIHGKYRQCSIGDACTYRYYGKYLLPHPDVLCTSWNWALIYQHQFPGVCLDLQPTGDKASQGGNWQCSHEQSNEPEINCNFRIVIETRLHNIIPG
mmetsp:Transcript_16053/g.24201  ORF Transcript_16053/g.24201 Transcript_16053/m.24201 type:complete len:215 (+) Transcript_16053:150-794(+)